MSKKTNAQDYNLTGQNKLHRSTAMGLCNNVRSKIITNTRPCTRLALKKIDQKDKFFYFIMSYPPSACFTVFLSFANQ